MKNETRHDYAFDYPELDKMSEQEFYDTYKNFMFAVAINEGLDHYQADMAIDDVLVVIFVKRRCHFDPEKSPFSNYLATMVRNACRSVRRMDHRYVSYEEKDMVLICEENGAVVKDRHERGEIRKLVEEAIEILRKEGRSKKAVDAVAMMLLDEEGPTEIAQKLNVRPDYVSVAMNHYRPRLQAILRRLMAQ